jgi:hypothetical protein
LFKIIFDRQQGGLANFSLLRLFDHMRPQVARCQRLTEM